MHLATRSLTFLLILTPFTTFCSEDGSRDVKQNSQIFTSEETTPSPFTLPFMKNKAGLDKAFLKAVQDKDVHGVRFLLGAGANSAVRIESGSTALHLASERGYLKIARVLLSNNPELIHLGNQEGVLPLHSAALHDSVTLAQILADHGARLNAQDVYGSTALHCAAFNDDPLLGRFLLSRGADPDATDKHNSTALHIASFVGNKRMVTTLVSEGVPVDAIDADGSTALHIAAFQGHGTTVRELLLMGADAELVDINGKTAKDYWCACKEHPTLVCDDTCLPGKDKDKSESKTGFAFA